jgi:transcriptional regulator with XRE-family HTH domain
MNGREAAAYVAKRLRETRQSLGLSLNDVCSLSDNRWHTSTVASYERGDRHPPLYQLWDLLTLYGHDLRDLLPPPGFELSSSSAPDESGQH